MKWKARNQREVSDYFEIGKDDLSRDERSKMQLGFRFVAPLITKENFLDEKKRKGALIN